MNIKHYTIDTETLSTCCGAPVSLDLCTDCKEHNEGEEVADQDQLFEALKEARDYIKDLKTEQARLRAKKVENDALLEFWDGLESELEQHLIS